MKAIHSLGDALLLHRQICVSFVSFLSCPFAFHFHFRPTHLSLCVIFSLYCRCHLTNGRFSVHHKSIFDYFYSYFYLFCSVFSFEISSRPSQFLQIPICIFHIVVVVVLYSELFHHNVITHIVPFRNIHFISNFILWSVTVGPMFYLFYE